MDDWVAQVTVRWVLVLVGVLMLALTGSRVLARPKSGYNAVLENLQVVLSVVVVVFLIIRPFLFQAFYIPSTSMEPTLHGPPDHPVGDRLIVNKLIYFVSDPHRFDIVVFRAPEAATQSTEEKDYIKRTIGLPNETVEVVPPRLLVDEEPALILGDSGHPAFTAGGQSPEISSTGNMAEITLPSATAFYGDTTPRQVRVIAEPDPQIQFDSDAVYVNGRVELRDTNSRITHGGPLSNYGGSPELNGQVFALDGQPRLIVVRGEQISFDDGHVLVNGRRLTEPYVKEAARYAYGPLQLGPNEYFMMGDNRNNSQDSHSWGPLERDRVIGRAEIIFWPLHRIQVFHWWLLLFLGGVMVAYNLGVRLLSGR